MFLSWIIFSIQLFRLLKLVMIDDLKGTIILYSVSDSEECRIARTELTALNIPFIDIPLDIFPQVRF